MPVARHFTATGFVVHDGHVLLHWHPKIGAWLSPGGHVEQNEDPVQAVRREVLEETGLEVEVVHTQPRLRLGYPTEVEPPYTIMVEDIHDPVDGFHKHIDMIYFCRPSGPPCALKDGWLWVSREDLAAGAILSPGSPLAAPAPDDVRLLGSKAFEIVEGYGP